MPQIWWTDRCCGNSALIKEVFDGCLVKGDIAHYMFRILDKCDKDHDLYELFCKALSPVFLIRNRGQPSITPPPEQLAEKLSTFILEWVEKEPTLFTGDVLYECTKLIDMHIKNGCVTDEPGHPVSIPTVDGSYKLLRGTSPLESIHLRLQDVLHGKSHGLGVALQRFAAYIHRSNIKQARNFEDEHFIRAAGKSYDLITTDRIMELKTRLHSGFDGPRLPKSINHEETFGLVDPKALDDLEEETEDNIAELDDICREVLDKTKGRRDRYLLGLDQYRNVEKQSSTNTTLNFRSIDVQTSPSLQRSGTIQMTPPQHSASPNIISSGSPKDNKRRRYTPDRTLLNNFSPGRILEEPKWNDSEVLIFDRLYTKYKWCEETDYDVKIVELWARATVKWPSKYLLSSQVFC
jgi:hypothetical protein